MKKILSVIFILLIGFAPAFGASPVSKEKLINGLNQTFLYNHFDKLNSKEKKTILRFTVCCQDAFERGWSDRINDRPFNYKQVVIAGVEFLNDSKLLKEIGQFYNIGYNMNTTDNEKAFQIIDNRMTEIIQDFSQRLK